MNKLTVFGIYMLLGLGASAQTVNVKNQEEQIGSDQVAGFATVLDGDKTDLQTAWIKFLKNIGKVRQANVTTIADPKFNDLTFAGRTIYSTIQEKGGKSTVWLGIKKSEWNEGDVVRTNHELEKAVHNFGVTFYRGKIQRQIDETQEASDAVEKQKQKLSYQGQNLATALSNNEKEKLQLEGAIEKNKIMHATLIQDIAKNKKAQDSLLQAGTQIQKVKASHQERQSKVE